MDDRDLKLRCLEIAVEQARREQAPNFEERVAILQMWLYNRVESVVEIATPDDGEQVAATWKRRGRPPKNASQ